MVSVDVSVIGAGPGGAWTAYSLARRGARVTIYDPSHPREKPCGGGVTGRALTLVADALGTASLPSVVVRSVRFVSTRAGEQAVVPIGPDRFDQSSALVVANRLALDALLLQTAERAGATLVSSRVTDIARNGHGWRVRTADGQSRSTGVIVGADGANSLVRRRVAHPFSRQQLSIATGFYAYGITSDEIVIETFADPPGYIWSFPRPSHLAIGVCAQADAGTGVELLRTQVRAWMASTGIAPGARLQAYSWPIPSLGVHDFDTLAPSGPDWYLVGDAAGLVDPITREGIYFALLSGEWAAEAIASSVARYTERVRDEIGAELGRAARFKAGFFTPRFTRLLVDALQHSSAVRQVMADLVAGRQGYAGLRWRLLRTFELGLAWRCLGLSKKRTPAGRCW